MRIKLFGSLQVIWQILPCLCIDSLHCSKCHFHPIIIVMHSELEPVRKTVFLVRCRGSEAWWGRRTSELFWSKLRHPIWSIEQCCKIGHPAVRVIAKCVVVGTMIFWSSSKVFVTSWHLRPMTDWYAHFQVCKSGKELVDPSFVQHLKWDGKLMAFANQWAPNKILFPSSTYIFQCRLTRFSLLPLQHCWNIRCSASLCPIPTSVDTLEMMDCKLVQERSSMLTSFLRCYSHPSCDSTTTDPLVHHGRHFGHAIFAFCNIKSLVINGLEHMCSNLDPELLTVK